MNVETDTLRWFQQVAEGITVTEVSELSGPTQPGVSRALRRLEAELGTPLLRRSGRRLQMTQAGEIFKRHVDALLHQLDDGIAAISQLIEPDTGTVAVAFQQSLGTWLVPDLVRTFRVAHPGRPLPADPGPGRAALGRPRRRAGRPRDRHPPPARPGRALRTDRGRAAAGGPATRSQARHPAAHSSCQLSGEPFISLRPASALRKLTDDLCEQACRPGVVFEGDDL